jgi:LysR family transcriptional regulator, glycine cleavage system transcriptional activator
MAPSPHHPWNGSNVLQIAVPHNLNILALAKDFPYESRMVAPSHLKSLQALELAVRKGSFNGAADVLAITPAAVGQRVKTLEDYLGVELLVRGRSGVRPTPELIAALPHLSNAFRELDSVARELELQRGHELHLAAASDFVELWLSPRLARFRAAHPNILFCINGEGDAPIRLGKVDCEISYRPQRESEDAELLFRDFVLPICSPANCVRTADIGASHRLEGFPLLHIDFYKDDPAGLSWPDWIAANAVERTAPNRGMRFQRITTALDAVLANAGIGMCGLALVAELVDDGRLALPYPASAGRWSEFGFTARFRSDWAGKAHLSKFRSWLLEESRNTREWLSENAGNHLKA